MRNKDVNNSRYKNAETLKLFDIIDKHQKKAPRVGHAIFIGVIAFFLLSALLLTFY